MADPSSVDLLELTPVPGGTRLRLRVKPGARKAAVLGVHGGALKVSVTEAPERGRANEGVLSLLADLLDVPSGSFEISSGLQSRDKTVVVPLDADALRERIGETLRDR